MRLEMNCAELGSILKIHLPFGLGSQSCISLHPKDEKATPTAICHLIPASIFCHDVIVSVFSGAMNFNASQREVDRYVERQVVR